jgi:hypothetical protein
VTDDGRAILAELRELVDTGALARVRARVAELPSARVESIVVSLLAVDATWRAAARLAEESVELPPDLSPEALAEALDDAATVADALATIDDIDGLIRATFDALTESEVRLLVFEPRFRAMVERRKGRR